MSHHLDVAESDTRRGDAGSDPRPPAASRRPSWLAVALIAGYAAHVAWRLWLARGLITPAAHADEDAYLIAARALAGGAGGGTTENEVFRRLGYPLLLSPIYWFTSDAFAVYRAAHVVNAVLNSLAFPLAYLFGYRVLGLSRRWAVGAAFATTAAPAIAFYPQFTITDAVIAPIGLCWLLMVHRWLAADTARHRLVGAVGAGVAAGFFYVVHVRGTTVVVVHGLLTLGVLLARRTSLRLAVTSVVATSLTVGLDPLLKYAIRGEVQAWGRSPKEQTVDAVTTVSGALRTLAGADGQVWYLGVATLGLGAVGLVVAALPLLRPAKLRGRLADPADGARLAVGLTALAATLLTALGSAAALPPLDNRVNYFAYPRYIHWLFPVWFLIGLAALLRSGTRTAVRLAAAGGALTLVTGAVVYLRVRPLREMWFVPFDAPEIAFLSWRWSGIEVIRPTLVALALGAVLLLALRRPRFAAGWLVGFVVLQAVAMHLTTERVTRPLVEPQYLADTPRLVRDVGLGPGDTVAIARREPTWYFVYNHMREVSWSRVLLFDQLHEGPPAQANVVIAPWHSRERPELDWDGTSTGYRLVATDGPHQWAVWRRD